MLATLVPVMGFDGPEEILLSRGDVLVLGRSESGSVQLRQTKVSRQHCRLFNDVGELFVEDLASTNGTHLNGVPLEPEKTYRVVPGDVIHAGQVPLTLETADPETGRNLVARMLRAVSPERRN